MNWGHLGECEYGASEGSVAQSRLVATAVSHVGAGVSEELQREEPRRSAAGGGQAES